MNREASFIFPRKSGSRKWAGGGGISAIDNELDISISYGSANRGNRAIGAMPQTLSLHGGSVSILLRRESTISHWNATGRLDFLRDVTYG